MIKISKIERSNRKTLSVSITQNGDVVIKAPLKLPTSEIERFIAEKQRWIESKLKNRENINAKFDEIINYNKILVLGKAYSGYRSSKIKNIEITDNHILVPDRITDDKLYKKLIKWYKTLADSVLIPRVKEISSLINITSSAIKCTGSRGRWGACNNKKEIFLNWRCIMLPPNLIDYVIMHEIAHIIELNHSSKFWAIVEKFMPDYKSRRQNLKQYGFILKLF